MYVFCTCALALFSCFSHFSAEVALVFGHRPPWPRPSSSTARTRAFVPFAFGTRRQGGVGMTKKKTTFLPYSFFLSPFLSFPCSFFPSFSCRTQDKDTFVFASLHHFIYSTRSILKRRLYRLFSKPPSTGKKLFSSFCPLSSFYKEKLRTRVYARVKFLLRLRCCTFRNSLGSG